MKALVVCTLLSGLASSLLTSTGFSAEPLSAEAMGDIQITPPSSPGCKPAANPGLQGQNGLNECSYTEQLKAITDQSVREILEADQATQVPHSSAPQLPPPPDTTYQQQQAIDLFITLPWGR